jgi:N-formylglutamate amidohydrolase
MSLDALYAKAKEENPFVAGMCVVGAWSTTLKDSDLTAFNTSLNDDDFSTRSLYDMYKAAGATFGLTSLREHRNGNCSCR